MCHFSISDYSDNSSLFSFFLFLLVVKFYIFWDFSSFVYPTIFKPKSYKSYNHFSLFLPRLRQRYIIQRKHIPL